MPEIFCGSLDLHIVSADGLLSIKKEYERSMKQETLDISLGKKIDKTYFQHDMAYQGCSETKRARLFLMNKIHSRKWTTFQDLWSSEPSETMPKRDDLYVHYLEWPGSSFLKESNESNSAICDNRLK